MSLACNRVRPYLHVLLQHDVEGREQAGLQLRHLGWVGRRRVPDQAGNALEEVVVEAGLRGVLADLQQHGRQPLQAQGGHWRDLHGMRCQSCIKECPGPVFTRILLLPGFSLYRRIICMYANPRGPQEYVQGAPHNGQFHKKTPQ